MISSNEVKTKVFELLTPYFMEKKFIKKGAVYTSKAGNVEFSVSVLLSHYYDTHYISFVLRLKHLDINYIIGVIVKNDQPEKRPNLLINQIDLMQEYDCFILDNFKNGEYKIQSEEDIHKMVESFTGFMNNYGFKFFESIDTVEKLDKYLNEPVINKKLKSAKELRLQYIYNGIMSAFFVKNPHFEKLLEFYRTRSDDEDFQENINHLITLLKEQS